MKILIPGARGQVGHEIARLAAKDGHETIPLTHPDLDISDESAVRSVVSKYLPTHIVNAAAYNAVDRAEDEPDIAFAANALGPECLARIAEEFDITLVHYSTDYVFDGTKETDYVEDDEPNPISVYGKSKLRGENAVRKNCDRHYILRTAWMFAPGGNNFVSRLLKKMENRSSFQFIDDQLDTPTYARDLAAATLEVLRRNIPYGLYHAVGKGACTPLEWARAVIERKMPGAVLEPVPMSSFPCRAKRPKRSVLSIARLESYGITIPNGLDRMDDYFRE